MLVDTLESFGILHSNEKFPPKFLVGCIWRQIKSIETEIENSHK